MRIESKPEPTPNPNEIKIESILVLNADGIRIIGISVRNNASLDYELPSAESSGDKTVDDQDDQE